MMSKAQLTALAATCGTAIACIGVVWLGFFSFFYMVQNATFTNNEKVPETPTSNFVVIGQYKGCDLVRWHDNMLADYRYFLYCENQLIRTQND
jgi:hypothetical protein